ncbi:hypothetical protein HanPSC8_Chr10g0426281 [Helianthus annuus]|nr:hypothetical protein HanPSC8_Chr10g0426281 [Helianthus annuus]
MLGYCLCRIGRFSLSTPSLYGMPNVVLLEHCVGCWWLCRNVFPSLPIANEYDSDMSCVSETR